MKTDKEVIETRDRLRRCLEHAPKTTAPSPVKGWLVDGLPVCANCAGRLMDRGCSLGDELNPLYIFDFCHVCKNSYGA